MFPTIGTKPVFHKNGLQFFIYSTAAVQGLIIHITHNQGKKKEKQYLLEAEFKYSLRTSFIRKHGKTTWLCPIFQKYYKKKFKGKKKMQIFAFCVQTTIFGGK